MVVKRNQEEKKKQRITIQEVHQWAEEEIDPRVDHDKQVTLTTYVLQLFPMSVYGPRSKLESNFGSKTKVIQEYLGSREELT